MADAARKDPKRLATTDERNPTRKAMAANPESTAAAPKVASPPAIPTQETASAAPLSASDSKLSGQAAASTSAARPSAGETAGLGGRFPIADAGALARNVGQAMEQGGEVLAAYLRPREAGESKTNLTGDSGEMIRSIGQLGQYYMFDPLAAFQAQTAVTMQLIDLWASTLRRFLGAPAALLATPGRPDKRFSDAEWRDNPYFAFIKKAYELTTHWADDLISRADDMDPHERDKAQFYLRQVTAALSP